MYRLEILAAAANALLLLAVSAIVIWEGIRRLSQPPEMHSGLVIVFALVALRSNGRVDLPFCGAAATRAC